MSNYKIYYKKFSFLLISFIFILSCGDKVPVKEMASAKMEISGALAVGAEKYAPQEINEAQKLLLESHDFVKNDKLEDSKKSAIASQKKAAEAYNKSLPLLAKDTLEIAKLSLEQADIAFAEVLAENEYVQAKNLYTDAADLYEKKEYYACYEKSVEADRAAKEAKNIAIGKKDILNNAIAEVKATLEQAEKYNASTYANDKVQAANDNLAIAEDCLAKLELKNGFAAAEIAGTNADEAYLTAIIETAKTKIESAEKLYAEAEKSEGALSAKDEIYGSKEALDQAKTLYSDSKYDESIVSSDESARLSNAVLGAMKDNARQKIAGAELVYSQAKDSPGASIAAKELNGAKDELDKSKSLYDEYKYKEAIAAAAESERLSNIVLNTKEKGGEGTGILSEDDYFIYKVKYIPERRDCLWRIADKYYSNPFLWKNIYKANTDKIRNPDLIWPDMLIKVPKMKKTPKPEAMKEEPAPETTQEAAPEPETVKEASESATTQEAAPATDENKETPMPEKPQEALPAPATVTEESAPEESQEIVPAPDATQELPAPATEPSGDNGEQIPAEEN